MKEINSRCPFQVECERKSCNYIGKELNCSYYDGNSRPGYEIDDQEEIRRRAFDESAFAALEDETDIPDADQLVDSGKLVFLPTAQIHPHPRNPRKDLGDISELAESIKAKGVLQNLTVVRGHWLTQEEWIQLSAAYKENPTEELRELMNRKWSPDEYTVIIGHRRLSASKEAGRSEVPCVIVEMTEREQFETMVIENVQRSDLTVYEQAESFQMMLDMGGTIESVSEQTGFSESTIRKRLNLTKLDRKKFADSIERGATLQDYAELEKIKDPKTRNKVLESIGTANFHAELQGAISREKLKAMINRWISYVSPFATKIKRVDWSIMNQVTSFSSYNDPKSYNPPEDAETAKYFYRVEDTYGVYLYKEKVISPEKADDEAKKQEAQEKFNRKKAEATEIGDLHYSLRRQFILDFSAVKKNIDTVMIFAIRAIKYASEDYEGIDWRLVAEILDISFDEENEIVDPNEFGAAIKDNPAYALFATACAACVNKDDKYWSVQWNCGVQEIVYAPNDTLDMLYQILCRFGYEMSDEEVAMQNGTHPIFGDDTCSAENKPKEENENG